MFKKLSIFAKIGFGFGIISFLLVILGLISLNAINSIVEQNKRVKMVSGIESELQQREIDHLKYLNKVTNTIADESATSIDVNKDPTKCKLGLFLSGPKRAEYEKALDGIKDVFANIEEPHRKLHNSVVKLEEMLQSDDATEADLMAYYKNYTVDAMHQIETQFEAARSLVDASIETSRQELLETESTVRMLVILGIVFAFVLAIIIALAIRRTLLKPIRQVVHLTEVVANGDLTQRVENFNDDEIGTIISAINLMAEKLDNSFFEVATNSLMLQNSADALSKVSSSLSDAAHTMSERANNVASASEEMSVTMANVSESNKTAIGNVETVSQNTNELTTTVEEIARNSEKARQISQDAVHSVQGATEQVNELGNAAQEINKVVEVIVDIAEQTKLLALNATIEAARAGEAGKGFAVVANEVKELAQQTNNATEEIRKSVDAMQRSTSNTVNEINKINGVIGEVDEIVSTIAAAVEEQNVATRDISANINQASEGIADMGHNVAQTAEVAKSVASDVAEVSAASEAVYSESSLVDAHTSDLQEVNKALTEVVQQFKISKNISKTDLKKEYMPWTDKFKLGVISIDKQHKRLVQLINDLHRDMREQRSIDNINRTMKGLVDYTVEHFAFEESMQEKAGYPGLAEHKVTHKKLVGQVQEYANKLAAGNMMISRDLMRFLKDWLSNHILKTDAQYVPYMKKAGL